MIPTTEALMRLPKGRTCKAGEFWTLDLGREPFHFLKRRLLKYPTKRMPHAPVFLVEEDQPKPGGRVWVCVQGVPNYEACRGRKPGARRPTIKPPEAP